MTKFMSAQELESKLVKPAPTARERLWQMEAEFINELVAHEGLYAAYPRRFTTVGNAKSFAAQIDGRRRHSFRPEECDLPGGFHTRVTDDDGSYQVWVAYTGEGQSDA